ncbi:MAG: hypothetical protein AMXMBFR16_08270 [Candidatus Uhrbacteria bacterium]|nr:MAG: hypothetical protein DCC77_03935 [Candidatus Uhrbacteria bacterium]
MYKKIIVTIIIFFIALPVQAKVRPNEILSVGQVVTYTDRHEHKDRLGTGSGTIIDDNGLVLTNYHGEI